MASETFAGLDLLRAHSSGPVVTPGDSGWDDARRAWDLNVDQRPAAVALPESERDVVAIVEFARGVGLRVAPQSTGHNAGPLAPLDRTTLVKTLSMRGVHVDPTRRRARVRAGALWEDVVPPAAEEGLAALAGTSPNVGVVGYSLGGGVGWLGRRYGLQANRVTAVELVTADGELVRADDEHERELFWALRGGGGSFGFVAALEFELLPVRAVYAGALVWDWRDARSVLLGFAEWAVTAPDLVTTSARILQLPPVPDVPASLRGRKIVMIDGAYVGERADGDAMLEPLRRLRPELDTFDVIPAEALLRLHNDPEPPQAVVSDHRLLSELSPDAVDALVAAAGPESESQLAVVEVRQLGGALGRRPERHGALARLDGAFMLLAGGPAADAELAAVNLAQARAVTGAVEPWSTGRRLLNFEERPADASAFFHEETHRRLQAVRAQVDPRGLFRANHPIAP